MRSVRRQAKSISDALKLNAVSKTGLADGKKGRRVGAPGIAIDQRSLHARARDAAVGKAFEVHKVRDYGDSCRGRQRSRGGPGSVR
jgi:hypothetical protein